MARYPSAHYSNPGQASAIESPRNTQVGGLRGWFFKRGAKLTFNPKAPQAEGLLGRSLCGNLWRIPPVIPFEHLAGNPRAWQETAHDLICAANLLSEAVQDCDRCKSNSRAPRPIVWRTLMMLYGLAAENLIKGMIVAKNPSLASKGSLPKGFRTHNLVELARQAGLPVSRSQEHLLKRLQVFVECGKYPVGLREGQDRSAWVSFGPSDSNDALQLLGYLEEELQRTSRGYVLPPPDLRGIR